MKIVEESKFEFLDALRGIAAIFIAIRHSSEFFGGNPFENSFLAVDLFFILSGFVIAHAYENRLSSGRLNFSGFLKLRIIRLYPAYILSVCACLVTDLVRVNFDVGQFGDDWVTNYILVIFFLPSNFSEAHMYGYLYIMNIVYWSLFYELLINIYYCFSRYFHFEKLTALVFMFSIAGLIYFSFLPGGIDGGFTWGIGSFALGLGRVYFGFFLGVYIYRFRFKLIVFLQVVPKWMSICLVVSVLAMPMLGILENIFQILSIFILFPVAVLLASTLEITNCLFRRFCLAAGVISYPLYVLHVPLYNLAKSIFPLSANEYAPISGLVFIVLIIVLTKYFADHVEMPLRTHLRNFFGK